MLDFLIIGQGLAGSLLAWELLQRDKTFLIVDNASQNASQVAAGLINPVTGMRLVKSNRVDDALPQAVRCYRELEAFFYEVFLREIPMLRVLQNADELHAAEKRIGQGEYRHLLDKTIKHHQELNSKFGVLKQRQTYLLNIPKLLACLKDLFIENNSYLETEFSYEQLEVSNTIQWNGYQSKQLIFCEGHRLLSNPFFNWLPLKPVKGEMLTIDFTASETLNNHILNYGYWLAPTENNNFRTGATFERDCLDNKITESAKQELLSELSNIINTQADINVSEQRAGIRPTTPDREPMIGLHPQHTTLAVFNGFGTKGSLMMPFYAEKILRHLSENEPLPVHIDIKRFANVYSTHTTSS